MKLDQLSVNKQEKASYCHSCGEVREDDQLGTCFGCGHRLCGLDRCSLHCGCDDTRLELVAAINEILASREGVASGNVLPPCWDAPGTFDEATAILQQIDAFLGARAGHMATA